MARVPGTYPPARQDTGVIVELEYGEQVLRADASRPRIELGRDHSCDLQVTGDAVSQIHARVLWDRSGVQIEDVSTNGTFIEQAGAGLQALHHGCAPLRGEGTIHLGDAQDSTRGAAIRYRISSAP